MKFSKLSRYSIFLFLMSGSSTMAETIALVNGKVMTAVDNQALANASVIIKDGVISEVGKGVRIPDNAKVIDVKGSVLTPGFIATDSTLAASEINGRANANDDRTLTPKLTAGFDIQYGVNPRSTLIPIARMEGVTRALVSPKTNRSMAQPFAGLSAAISLSAKGPTIVSAGAAEVLDLKSYQSKVSRGAAYPLLKKQLAGLQKQLSDKGITADNWREKVEQLDPDTAALLPVMLGERPLIIRVDKAIDIENLLRLLKPFQIRAVLQGAAEGWLVADQIAKQNVPVIVDTYMSLPMDFDMLNTRLDNAALLEKAGVTVIIRADKDGHFARNARYYAGMAVANGMDRHKALQAITSVPAKIFGMKSTGALASGMTADVAVWSGDPFEPLSQLQYLFIAGEAQPLSSRHTELRDRYLP